jgi:glycosyltransferase involved in cell wall biosynthesis
MRFHILGVPHTATNRDWLCCAFTQKVAKLCAMLHDRGHHVIHYGNEASDVTCSEHVTVTRRGDIGLPADYLDFKLDSQPYSIFSANAIEAVNHRKQPRDFLLCPFGLGHETVAAAHQDMIVVEPGIGYASSFARWKVFESYAVMHAHYGMKAVATCNVIDWYDAVIPNFFDPADFEFRAEKGDYLLFLGRVYEGKGVHVAVQVAEALGKRLVVAGPGKLDAPRTEHVGAVDGAARRELLAGAGALIAPSIYVEPFCGVVIEAAFSGTPVITSDWGAFAENVLHGVTGYRCRIFEQFLWAAKNIDRIRPVDCRCWAEANFTMGRVGKMYDEYFSSVLAIYGGNGWYEANGARQNLDWLTRRYPPAAA